MQTQAFLIDVVPWLITIADRARDFPSDFPIADANLEKANALITDISAFAQHWVGTLRKLEGSPCVPTAEGTQRTPTSTAVKRRAKGAARMAKHRARKRLKMDESDTEQGSGHVTVSETAGLEGGEVPRGSRSYWNRKLQGIFASSTHLIPAVLANYVKTLAPEKQRVVRHKLESSPASRVGQLVVTSLKAAFQACGLKNTTVNVSTRMGGAAMAFGEDAVGMEAEISKVLGVNQGVVSTGILGHRNLLLGANLAVAQRRRNGLLDGLMRENMRLANSVATAELNEKIKEFWLSPGMTRVSTAKRDVIQIRHEDGTVEKVSKHWLEMTQLEVYRKFQKKYPSIKICLRGFEQRKPLQVRRLTRRDTISCCCRYHEELRMNVSAYHHAHEMLHSHCACSDRACCPHVGGQRAILSNRKYAAGFPDMVCGRAEVGRSTSGFVSSLLCPRRVLESGEQAEHHDLPCLQGWCEDCGYLKNMRLCATEIAKDTTVEWSTYENQLVGVDAEGKNKHRVKFVQKKTSVAELVGKLQASLLGHFPGKSPNCLCIGTFVVETAGRWELTQLDGVGGRACPFLKPYAYHCFMATHSMRMFNMCKDNLPQGHCMLLFDFSENHALNIPREIQSLHWIVQQATLLCCVLWRHAYGPVDGVQSTPEKPVIIKDLIYLMGDDFPHSHRGIQHMRKLIVKKYFLDRGLPIPVMFHEWADGSGVQNKCGTAFADVIESFRQCCREFLRGLGIPTIRNLFETAHARGEQDAMGVAVKHFASLAVMAVGGKWYGRILCAYDLWRFCCEELRKPADSVRNRGVKFNERFFFLVNREDVDESGPTFKAVDRTLALHQVRAGVGLLAGLKRDRQCYCEYCYDQCSQAQPDSVGCHNKSHVDEWVPFTLVEESEAQARQTRAAVAEACHERGVEVARGAIFARQSAGDPLHPYYLVKALSGVQQALEVMEDDYYTSDGSAGVKVTPGEFIIEGRFLEWRDEELCDEYYLETTKKCLSYSHHVVCAEVTFSKRRVRGRDFYKISNAEHQRILALVC
jgi:hypothetical protein